MQIFPLTENYINNVVQLSDNVFGVNFLTQEYIKQYINSSMHIGLIAIQNDNFIGYIFIDILAFKIFLDEILKNKDWFKDYFKDYENICLIKQIAIEQQYQQKGIATQLIKNSLFKLNAIADISCCFAWKKENTVALKSSLSKNNFNYKITIDNYWKEDSIAKKYNCTHCGTPPCKCATEVWVKKKH